MTQNNIIHIAAAIITNRHNQMLLVRKQGSMYFMQAGGKIEISETPIQTLIRELQEELHLTIEQTQCDYLGEFLAPAANEANHIVKAHLFSLIIPNTTTLSAQAELIEVSWYSLTKVKSLAPLTKDIILPLIKTSIKK